MKHLRLSANVRRLLAAAGALLLLSACANEHAPRGNREAVGAPQAAPLPEMEAHATFFAGQVEAEVLTLRPKPAAPATATDPSVPPPTS